MVKQTKNRKRETNTVSERERSKVRKSNREKTRSQATMTRGGESKTEIHTQRERKSLWKEGGEEQVWVGGWRLVVRQAPPLSFSLRVILRCPSV